MRHDVGIVNIIVTSLALFLLSVSIAQASCCDLYRPVYVSLDSCEPCYDLKDGLYIGIGTGYNIYQISEKVAIPQLGAPVLFTNPHIYTTGWLGNVFIGFGQYFERFYVGGELFANYSNATGSFKINSLFSNYEVNVNARASYGASILPGVKLNRYTLLYGRLGYTRTTFESTEQFNFPPIGFNPRFNTTKYGNGLNFGVGFEMAIVQFLPRGNRCFWNSLADHLSLRADYIHTTYDSWESQIGTTYTPSNNQVDLSLNYHFP